MSEVGDVLSDPPGAGGTARMTPDTGKDALPCNASSMTVDAPGGT